MTHAVALPICVVVPCMGRLGFLARTASSVLASPMVSYCLVDYSCPERCGDWFEAQFAVQDPARRFVERVPNQVHFNKSAACNAGARRAIREGARTLCFLDADTLVGAALFEWLLPKLDERIFFIAGLRPDGSDVPSLTGALALSRSAFLESGGFDEQFRGWGGEDIEYRLRLHALHGLEYSSISLSLLEPIEHGDQLRVRFYEEQDIEVSNRHNLTRILGKLNAWRRNRGGDLASARRLFYQGSPGSKHRPSVAPRSARHER